MHTSGTELAQQLANDGLAIAVGREKALLEYLGKFQPTDKMIAATSLGWHGESFVLPNQTLNQPENETIIYQPQSLSNIAEALTVEGDFHTWQQGMTNASPLVMFLVQAALSTPARNLCEIESGGFHIAGLTSQGKTTALQAAASVWGNASDPSISGGQSVYIQKWNSTANALEGKAELFNDLPMIIDEIGEGDLKEFGQTIYRLFGGVGRSRAGREGELRSSKAWRTCILSAGEIGIGNFLEQGGNSAKGGMLVRLPDIAIDDCPPLFQGAAQANLMKTLCSKHYGHAGAMLVPHLHKLASLWCKFDQSLIGNASNSIQERVRARFALVAFIGQQSVKLNILPWSVTVQLWHTKPG